MQKEMFAVAFASAMLCAPSLAKAQETTAYTYDALGRLTKVAVSGGAASGVTQSYTFDAAGNRTNVTVAGAPNGGGQSNCSFRIHDAAGNDEFTLQISIEKVGVCSGAVQISYTTNHHGNPSGIVSFSTNQVWGSIDIPPECCRSDGLTIPYNANISIYSGNASITRSQARFTIAGNG